MSTHANKQLAAAATMMGPAPGAARPAGSLPAVSTTPAGTVAAHAADAGSAAIVAGADIADARHGAAPPKSIASELPYDALRRAVEEDRSAVVRRLLALGDDPEVEVTEALPDSLSAIDPAIREEALRYVDDNGHTLMHVATNGAVMRALVAAGLHVDERDWYNCTPLHLLCNRSEGRFTEGVATLIKLNADLAAVDDFLQTPLHYAVIRADTAAAKLLVDAGADPFAADVAGRTVIDLTTENNRTTKLRDSVDLVTATLLPKQRELIGATVAAIVAHARATHGGAAAGGDGGMVVDGDASSLADAGAGAGAGAGGGDVDMDRGDSAPTAGDHAHMLEALAMLKDEQAQLIVGSVALMQGP